MIKTLMSKDYPVVWTYPATMPLEEFKNWVKANKEAILKTHSNYLNHHVLAVDENGNYYKIIRRGQQPIIVPRETMKTKRQMIDDIEQLKAMRKELDAMEEKLRHFGDLLVLKGIDVEQPNEKSASKAEFINYGPV